jgi:hypothetical protein
MFSHETIYGAKSVHSLKTAPGEIWNIWKPMQQLILQINPKRQGTTDVNADEIS